MIGTGPYKVASFEPGVRATFERNADDWRTDRGYVDSVELIAMNDATARIAALSSGQVHFINRVDPKTVNLLKKAPTVEILNTSGRGHYVFIMHCNTAPFDNNDLRMALKYAMDRETLVQRILGGYGKVGNDFPINDTYALFPEGIEQRAYDPDKAAFHYKKSGHSGPVRCAPRTSLSPARSMPLSSTRRAPRRRASRSRSSRAGRRLLVQRLERPTLFDILLGRASDPGPDVLHRLSLDSRLERHPLQASGFRQDPARSTFRARRSEAQGHVPHHGDDGARRRRPDPADVQRLRERGR